MAEITMEGIIKKLGFDPLKKDYSAGIEGEDDNWENPFNGLTPDELKFVHNAALADPKCYSKNQ